MVSFSFCKYYHSLVQKLGTIPENNSGRTYKARKQSLIKDDNNLD